jgi:hypothetical protein
MSMASLWVDPRLPKVPSPANNLRLSEISWWGADPCAQIRVRRPRSAADPSLTMGEFTFPRANYPKYP